MTFSLRKILSPVFALCISFLASAQSESRHFFINYVINIAEIDTTFLDNKERIGEMFDYLRSISDDDRLVIDSVRFSGTASPDGYYEFNNWLSENRLENFKKLIRTEIEIPDSIISRNDSYITWKRLRDAVEESDIPRRDEVLRILDMEPALVPWYKHMHTDHRLLKLRSLDQGRVWETLKPILFRLRFADAEFIIKRRMVQHGIKPTLTTFNDEWITVPSAPVWLTVRDTETWTRRLYLKTNLIDLGMLIGNLAVEIDIAPHWSFTLPFYYSALDYFKSQLKFRIAGIQPEIRYWFNSKQNDGFFIGAHYGFAWYNMAFNGKYRYQDLDGRTPTSGGGLALGWRKQIGYKKRWRLELSAGAGVYPLHYDVFENTPDVKDGRWVETRKKTFIGLDQAAVTIGYAFDIYKHTKIKKGGLK